MRVSQAILDRHIQPNEPLVILMVIGVGTTMPFDFLDNDGREYTMKWNSPLGCHAMKIPASLWSANNHKMARNCMERRRQQFPIIIGVEFQEAIPGEGRAGDVAGDEPVLPSNPIGVSDEVSHVPGSEAVDDAEAQAVPAPGITMLGQVRMSDALAALVSDGALRTRSILVQLGGDTTAAEVEAACKEPDSKVEYASGWVRIKQHTT